MTIYNVSYDLRAPGRDYKDLYDEIGRFGSCANPVESTWLIECDLTATQLANRLLTVMDSNDKLIITKYGDGIAWYNLDKEVEDWIRRKL